MNFVIELVRNSVETGGRDRFSLGDSAWDLMLEVGKTFGWQPAGTVYLRKPSAKGPDSVALHDYKPGNHRDYKVVSANDAKAWAVALRAAQGSPHLAALLGARPGVIVLNDEASLEATQSMNAPFESVMTEFGEYAFGGAFSFARAR